MAEEDIMMEEDSVALQDTDDSTVEDANVDSIIPFVIDRYKLPFKQSLSCFSVSRWVA